MSSVYVVDQFKQFLQDNAPSEQVVDLTARYEEIKELMEVEGVPVDSPWLGVEFIGDDEIPVGLSATNDQGCYRETGALIVHVVDVARLGGGNTMRVRGETLRNLFRGMRIGDILIESVTPMNFNSGATLEFEGGYMSGSFIVSYQRDVNL